MSYGYSQLTVTANKQADKRLLGVALGRACIANGVPVADVAQKFSVSRQTVYNWFEGRHEPGAWVLEDIKAFIESLAKK